MTMEGTTNKGLALMALVIAAAAFSWMQAQSNPDVTMLLVLGGAIGGFVTAIVTIFNPKAAPISGPIYAILEGIALGAFSSIFEGRYQGIVMAAVVLTLGLLLIMFLLYRARVVRATPKLTKVVMAATGAIALAYVISIVAGMFGAFDIFGLQSGSPVGILISLVIIGVACFNFILDFDLIERGVDQGVPKYMEWYCAFGVLVTLVWLYLEMLRLLANLQRRD